MVASMCAIIETSLSINHCLAMHEQNIIQQHERLNNIHSCLLLHDIYHMLVRIAAVLQLSILVTL